MPSKTQHMTAHKFNYPNSSYTLIYILMKPGHPDHHWWVLIRMKHVWWLEVLSLKWHFANKTLNNRWQSLSVQFKMTTLSTATYPTVNKLSYTSSSSQQWSNFLWQYSSKFMNILFHILSELEHYAKTLTMTVHMVQCVVFHCYKEYSI